MIYGVYLHLSIPQTLITKCIAHSRLARTEYGVHIEYRVQRPNGRQWVHVPALVEATAHIVEWQAVETHQGLLWLPLAGWVAVYKIPPTTARPRPVEQDHGVGVVIDVLSGEDEAQGDIDRTLLSEPDQNPHRLPGSLIFTTQPWTNKALPDTNPLALRAELEGARRGQSPGADSTDSSITSLPSSPR
jgi:hypothetical protein